MYGEGLFSNSYITDLYNKTYTHTTHTHTPHAHTQHFVRIAEGGGGCPTTKYRPPYVPGYDYRIMIIIITIRIIKNYSTAYQITLLLDIPSWQ